MALIYVGNSDFDDVCAPVAGKSEWGIDTLTRTLKGARYKLADFIATLAQGQSYAGNYFLQTWEPDDTDPVWGSVKLQYKGLLGGTIPDPVIENAIVEATGNSSHLFDPPYDWAGGDEDKKAISAVMDFSYYCGQTQYRYITDGQNSLGTYGSLGFGFETLIKKTRITVQTVNAGDIVFGGNAPVGIVSALTPVLSIGNINFQSHPVFGTNYFECEDTVRAELLGAS